MESMYIKKGGVITLGLFLLGIVNVLGQDPIGPISLDKPGYYQHGYNKDNTTSGAPDTPREDRDSVMVGSTMRYFVMPDRNSNKGYYDNNGGNYTLTNLTKSEFKWTVPLTGAFGSFINANESGSGTSSYVTITWNTPSAATPIDTIRMTETPKEYKGAALPASVSCPGEETKIPVTVIPKPTIWFGELSNSRTAAACASFNPDEAENPSTNPYPVVEFPLVVDTKSSQVEVKYTITLDGTSLPTTEHNPLVAVKVSDVTKLPVKFGKFGTYVVTITEITDRIARKCSVVGTTSTTASENTFTYVVLPQPKAGKTYHIPNNF